MKGWESAVTIFSTFAALIFVLGVAYLTIRWMSRRMSLQPGTRIIKVIDRVMIGQDKCLLIIQIGEKAMLIGMSQNSVQKLSDLEDIPQLPVNLAQGAEFSEFLMDTFKKGWTGIGKKGGRGSE